MPAALETGVSVWYNDPVFDRSLPLAVPFVLPFVARTVDDGPAAAPDRRAPAPNSG